MGVLRGIFGAIADRPSLRHPVDRGERNRRTPFDGFAQLASHFASSPLFFLVCLGLVAAWALGFAVGAGATYEQVMGTVLTAVALLLIALLKNSELRSEAAMQEKLDALAIAMLEAIREETREADKVLERAIKIEDEV